MKKNKTNVKHIVHDVFTIRLNQVFTALTEKEALAKKRDFVSQIGITAQNFIKIEHSDRNYPINEEMRKQTTMNLFTKFMVNPEFLSGKSEKMFLQEPQKVERAVKKEVLSINFQNKNEKLKLIEERDEWRRKYFECAQMKGLAAEPEVDYQVDKEGDKKEVSKKSTTRKKVKGNE